jgi:predicted RNA-binding Zn ribbon-like protein
VVFTNDVEATLASIAALVNTLPELSDSGEDELETREQLDGWVRGHGYTGSRSHDDEELDGARRLRPRLHALWLTESEEEDVEIVNAMLRDGSALPQLVRHEPYSWHIHATSGAEPLARRIMVEAAMAWTEVIRQDERDRLRICLADDCESVLVDLSRNRSKRYCDTGNCGNRANVQAYRRRRAGG